MSVPPEYTEALENLKAFRTKILTDLVGGRVIAGLDASHDSMLKFSGIIDGLSVTPYMFGKVKEKALALKFKGKDVGVGKLKYVKGEYVGGKTTYPLKPPYHVPQRSLPQVDVFLYDVIKDLDLLDKTNTESLKSFVLVQANSGTFEETANAENALYDYYEFIPQNRHRGKWTITGQKLGYSSYETIEGEYVVMLRRLVKAGTMEDYEYWLYVFIDGNIYSTSALLRPFSIMTFHIMPSAPAPSTVYSIAGQRVPENSRGLWGTGEEREHMVPLGFGCFADTITPVTDDIVWSNHFSLKIEVNNPAWGTTSPAPSTYTKEAYEDTAITALPNAGYKLDHWERDGVTISTTSPYTVRSHKDYEVKCVFAPV